MTPSKTPFAGLEALGPGDPLSSDGYYFVVTNPVIIDRLLRVGAVTHRHDAHAALASPSLAMTLADSSSGGTIPGGTVVYATYTLIDADGGETLPVAVQTITMPAGYASPTTPPTAALDHTAGTLLAGTFEYALTVTDGAGGETVISPGTQVVIDPGFAHSQVTLSGLAAIVTASSGGAVGAGWRLWRRQGGSPWYLIATGVTDTFLDNGVAGDCTLQPPDTATTTGTNSLQVTVPGGQPAGTVNFGVYLSLDGSFTSPAQLGIYPASELGTPITVTSLGVLLNGQPPAVSLAFPGAHQIDPDTEIIAWPWKRPVANAAALPALGNSDGDMRETLDTHTLYVWNGTSDTWVAGGGAVGPAGPRGSVWFTGHGAPGSIGGEQNQDMYLNVDSGDYYQLIAGTWTLEGTLADLTVQSNHQTANYTLVLGDAAKVIEMDVATANTLTIPPHSGVALPVGTVIEVCQVGAGATQIVAGAGVTLDAPGGLVHTGQQWGTVGLRQRAADEWVLSGDLG